MALGARVALAAKTVARRGLQPRRPQPLPDFRQIRRVLRSGCGIEGEGDGVGKDGLAYENDAS
jgi:hypothetical protein